MISWHRVGVRVTPLRSSVWDIFRGTGPAPQPKFGVVYTISEVGVSHGCVWLTFADLGVENGFHAAGFRPVRETDISSLQAIAKSVTDRASTRRDVREEV